MKDGNIRNIEELKDYEDLEEGFLILMFINYVTIV